MISLFRKRARWSLVVITTFTVGFSFAHASVVITGTRVIYPANQREVSVKLNSNGAVPALVQSWVDDGDPDAKAKDKPMPFTLLPPVARIDPGKGQTLRMMYTQDPLPQDRESVYYLNVLEVPPRPPADLQGENLLQMAFRSRIKIFFRPVGLSGNPNETPAQVSWQVVKAEDGKGYALKGENPTVFHANYAETSVKFGDKSYASDGGMIPPRSSRLFPLAGLQALPVGAPEITFNAIDDYGGSHPVTLKPGMQSEAQ
ncbi:MAG: fimbria/pilus periplasmic chaperone [Pseudomonas sp.]|uniref:fimbria/pilus periplasmic chaperone n=1 Tax=Pseudomonas sp. TaxID=306 RepID=UPI003D6F8311